MRQLKRTLAALSAAALLAAALAGCAGAPAAGESTSGGVSLPENDRAAQLDEAAAVYSAGLDENGFWAGITAGDYVEPFDYDAIEIPADVHAVTDEAVEEELAALLASYAVRSEVTDRAVATGDTVNVDYEGTIDGEAFENGSTGGAGADMTIGDDSPIAGFLTQLVGRRPGEQCELAFTFPEDYSQEELRGQNAVFATTINHIVEHSEPRLSDAFVAENLAGEFGWRTVDDLYEGLRARLRQAAIKGHIEDTLAHEVKVSAVPEALVAYFESSMLHSYQLNATYNGVSLEEYLYASEGVSSPEALLEVYRQNIRDQATYYLVVQAIAEDAGITAGDGDVAALFQDYFGGADPARYEAQYGRPYLKQITLVQLVLDRLVEHAVLT